MIALPRLSNATDIDALAAEPGVLVRFATRAEELTDADLVLLPGSRATVADLDWLRARGFDVALARHVALGGYVLGVCGGYQMLGTAIVDDVESGAGEVAGLGLLPVRTVFARAKVLARPSAAVPTAYEIHHGVVAAVGGEPFPGGCRVGPVFGTVWHGLLEDDAVRRDLLCEVAAGAGRDWQPGRRGFAEVRKARLDALGDLVAAGLDTDAVLQLIEAGAPGGLPFVPPGAP